MKKNLIIIGVGIAAVVVGVIFFTTQNSHQSSTNNTNEQTKEPIGQEFEILPSDHIKDDQTVNNYNSNPPTSGPHYEKVLPWGSYPDPVKDESAVHNLEHGGIWISYRNIDEDTLRQLKTFASNHQKSVLLSPRPKNDSRIVVASWGRMQSFETLDLEAIEQFLSANLNNSPEPFAK